jgi:hypothetical protein
VTGETVWDVQAGEARYEADRVEHDEPWLLDADLPTRADLRDDPRPTDMGGPVSADPWQTDTLVAGDRVYHILNTDPAARANGTGTVLQRGTRGGWSVGYLVDYDKGGQGWHRSADVRQAGGDDVPPF